MAFLRRLLHGLRAMFGRPALEAEMQDEMRAHLEQAAERLVARGLTPEQAAIEARREFGNRTVHEEDGRSARGTRWGESLVADVRFALRHLRRTPLATTIIVLVLALGIGVNSVIFSVVQAVTSRPAPGMPQDERHVRLYGVEQTRRGARWQWRGMSYRELRELAGRTEAFSGVAGYTTDDAILSAPDVPSRDVRVQFITSDYFRTLGVSMQRGRPPRAATPEEEIGEPNLDVVISNVLWDDLYARSDSALGATVKLDGMDVRIVGVAPPSFIGPLPVRAPTGVWAPVSARAAILNTSTAWLTSPDSLHFTIFARLAPRMSIEQATPVARSVATASLAQLGTPRPNATWSMEVFKLRKSPTLSADDPLALFMFAGIGTAALLILLVACTNVSSLLVAQAVARRQEIAVRLSLGAPRSRVVRQLVTESAILAVAGGLAGLSVFWVAINLLQPHISNATLTPDVATLTFTLLIATATGILFGLSPALHATGSGIATAMRDTGMGTTRRSRLQGNFVIAQIALTQPLLVSLAVLLWAALGEQHQYPEASLTDRVAYASFRVAGGSNTYDQRRLKLRGLMERLANEPGIVSVIPDARGIDAVTIAPDARDTVPGLDVQPARVVIEGLAPGYFPLHGVPILRGRDVQLSDSTALAERPVVVSSELARSFWGVADPIGRRLVVPGADSTRVMTVVGVMDGSVKTMRGAGLRVYTAVGMQWSADRYLVRTAGPAAAMIPAIRDLVKADQAEVPLSELVTVSDKLEQGRREVRQIGAAVAAAGALALVLASIGLYGVIALSVGQRQREIGVRIALGGQPFRVARMFFTSGVRLSVLGLAFGLPLSMIGLRLLSTMFVGPELSLPLIGAGVAGSVLVVASLATWLPARRAATVDPAIALRVE